jgi:antitoxin component of MazEF toxin-antitoxin module
VAAGSTGGPGMVLARTPFVTRAVRATKGSASLRVTIPQVVASTLGLQPGDDLFWIVDPQSGIVRVQAATRRR